MSTLEILASTPPSYKPSVYKKDPSIKMILIPLNIALKIFTRRLEKEFRNYNHAQHQDEAIDVSEDDKQRKVHIEELPDLITKANSACDMYQVLFQDDIKNSRGNVGLIAHWIEVFEYEWKNELNDMKQKEIYKGTVPLRNKQIKWKVQGLLPEEYNDKKKKKKGKEKEQIIVEKIHKKDKAKQTLLKDEKYSVLVEEKSGTFSWADEVEARLESMKKFEYDERDESKFMGDEMKQHQDETEHNKDESDHNHDHDNIEATNKFFPYRLKEHAKLIYKELEKELDTRNKLYEMDKISHVSVPPTGKMKKTGQKKRRHNLKLVNHEHSLCGGGLANRRRTVNKMFQVTERWKIVLTKIQNVNWLN